MKNNPIYRFLMAGLHFLAAYFLFKIDIDSIPKAILPWFDRFTLDLTTVGVFTGSTLFLLFCLKARMYRLFTVLIIGFAHMVWSFNDPDAAKAFGYMLAGFTAFITFFIAIRGFYFFGSLDQMPNMMRGVTISNQLSGAFDTILSPRTYDSDSDGKEGLRDAIKYRDAKLGTMSNAEGAKLLRDTASLDAALLSSNSGNTGDAARFLSSKLGTMSNEAGIDYLRGKRD